ncbi:MAG: ABC-type transport auxiliary lipoprotein family protein [Campylobacterota bacterium]|nr:ABC-type transport auxiliary lipoprotein family protein [Campylobacterota bacterium]
MKQIAIAIVLILLGGCSVQQSVSPSTSYRLKPLMTSSASAAEGCAEKTLRVSLTHSSNLMQNQSIYYVDEAYGEYSYSRSRWIESPSKQFRHLLEDTVARNGAFKSVITYNSQAYNDMLLESKIMDFMQYFEGKTSYVRLVVQLTLIDQDTRKVISTHYVEKRKATETADAEGAVKAFNQLVQEMLSETVEWLNGECN